MTPSLRHPFRTAAICHVLVAAPLFGDVDVHLAEPSGPVPAGTDYLLRPEVTGAGAATGVDWAVAEDFKLVDEADGVSLKPDGKGGFLFRASASKPRTFQVRATAQADRRAFGWITLQVEPRAGAGTVETKSQVVPRIPGGDAVRALPAETKAWTGDEWLDGTVARRLIRQDPGTPWLWETPFGQRQKHKRTLLGIALDPRAALPTIVAVEGLPGGRIRVVRIDLLGRVAPVVDPLVLPKDAPPLDPDGHIVVAVAPDGDVLMAPTYYSRILRVAPNGATSLLADADGPIELQHAYGLDVTAEGDVVFSDGRRICRLDHARKRRELLVGMDPAEVAFVQVRNDLSLEHPAAATTLDRPGDLVAAPDGRILLSSSLGVLAIHRDGTIRRITPRGVGSMRLAVGPDNQVYFTAIGAGDSGRRFCRLEADGTVTGLNRAVVVDDELPETHERLASSARGLSRIHHFLVLPGGGILYHDKTRLTLMGPAPSDESLVKLVQDGVQAALHGPWAKAERIRDSLRRRAEQSLESTSLLETASVQVGKDLPKPLAQPLVRKIGEYAGADPKGLSFRAWVALYVLDREVRDHRPELADKLAAFPRRGRAAGAGGTEAGAGAGVGAMETKAGAGKPKAPAVD